MEDSELLGLRGVGEGAESEEPAVCKGGTVTDNHLKCLTMDTYTKMLLNSVESHIDVKFSELH